MIQQSNGKWRAESAWPPKDGKKLTVPLNEGVYTDTGVNNGTGDVGPPNGDGIWTISPALKRWTHMAGIPRATVDVEIAQPDANLVVDVYDIDKKLSALLITRNAYLVPESGQIVMDLYGQDWIFKKGHRIGVLVTSSNAEWWAHTPTGQDVSVTGGKLTLRFLTCERKRYIQGKSAIRLDDYKEVSGFTMDEPSVTEATSKRFPTPPRRLKSCRR